MHSLFLLGLFMFLSAFSPMHSFSNYTENDLKKLDDELVRSLEGQIPRRQGFGIVYFVYHEDRYKVLEYMKRTLKSAASFRAQSTVLQIALLISDKSVLTDSDDVNNIFNFVIEIPKIIVFPTNNRGQWITRAFATILTPFELTLAMDSDTYCCGAIQEALEKLNEWKLVDFAVTGHSSTIGQKNSFLPQMGTFLFRTSPILGKDDCFESLRQKWLLIITKWEVENKWGTRDHDDQLMMSIALSQYSSLWEKRQCEFHRLSTSFNAYLFHNQDIQPKTGEQRTDIKVLQTQPLVSKVFVLHNIGESGNLSGMKWLCEIVNRNETSIRTLTYWGIAGPQFYWHFGNFNVSYSLEECNNAAFGLCDPNSFFDVSHIISPLIAKEKRKISYRKDSP